MGGIITRGLSLPIPKKLRVPLPALRKEDIERFVLHLKYLAQRLYEDKALSKTLSGDAAFASMIRKTCNKHYKCALRIQEYILKTYKKSIDEDEILTLTIHLKKVSTTADFS